MPQPTRHATLTSLALLAGLVLAGPVAFLKDGAVAGTASDGHATVPLSAMATLGEKMFFDIALSASGKQSCASCHDPKTAYAPNNALAVQLGGPHLDLPGFRAVPSLGYMNTTPVFEVGPESLFEVEGQQAGAVARTTTGQSKADMAAQAMANPVPEGGFFWDGRADTLEEQPAGPLLSPFEMANADAPTVVAKLKAAPYAADFAALFGSTFFDNVPMAMSEASFALARYETEDPDFHFFSSKYDAYLRGKATLTDDEMAGLKLFEDPKKGNCSSCHLDQITPDGQFPVFTDFEYEALAVPRNPTIPANADPRFFDLGICGPTRDDTYAHQAANCALFKTPTLRNVATRHAFFHNGVFNNLDDVLHWYVERDTNPEKFYPHSGDGSVQTFNDVPPQYRGNVDVIDAPFNRHPGDKPALNDHEIDQIIAFLNTLTDGYARP